ncbi:MAG: glycosyltransferase family 1 protein [Patescibacteria group bacterium]
MKVGFIIPPLIQHETRGTGIYAKNLASALEAYTDWEVVRVHAEFLPTAVDIYHFPYFDPFFLTLPIFRSKKTVVTIHDLIPLNFPQHFPRGIKGEIKWRIQRIAVSTVNAIITDSMASKHDIETHLAYNKNKIHTVYLAAAKEFQTPRDKVDMDRVRDKYHLPKEFFLFVGESNWNKNIPNIIRAIKSAEASLVIVNKSFTLRLGDNYNSWQDALIEAQHEAEGYERIFRLGGVELNDLVTLYKMASALIMPSYYEGFGIPVVEAFSAGCPVITTNRGSL